MTTSIKALEKLWLAQLQGFPAASAIRAAVSGSLQASGIEQRRASRIVSRAQSGIEGLLLGIVFVVQGSRTISCSASRDRALSAAMFAVNSGHCGSLCQNMFS